MAVSPSPARLVLASASPRRKALLSQLGIQFDVAATHVNETPLKGIPAAAAVQEIAYRKLTAYLQAHPETTEFVLAVDTDVYLNGRLLGKPQDAQAATAMLQELQGTSHIVYSGLALAAPHGRKFQRSVASRVQIAPMDPTQIRSYVETGEPMDKAGGYAAQGQGAAFIIDVEGDFTNVVGLPLRATLELFTSAGFPLPPHLRPS